METPHSEQDLLHHDIAEIRRLLDTHREVLERLADMRDPARHTYLSIVAELFFRMWVHAAAVDVLLRENLFPSTLVVMRSIFDALVVMGYLVKHPDSKNEAVILRAFSYLRDIKDYAHQTELVTEYTRVLSIMPPELVALAKRRSENRPWTWSGKTVKRMAIETGIQGYDAGYSSMSGEAHASAMGRLVQTIPEGKMVNITTGRPMTPKEVEASANYARRALHTAFLTMWGEFDGPKMTIHSKDPYLWLQEHKQKK